jgi:hypothetical protein
MRKDVGWLGMVMVLGGQHYRYCGFLRQRAVEHAEMPSSTCKQKTVYVFFQKRATNLQPAVNILVTF